MDQKKTGSFIAALRRGKGLTQEALGEKLGVTNKTVSRWENGNYMPDIEMLRLLSSELGVSINELISGERLNAPAEERKSGANAAVTSRSNAFSLNERKAYFKKKWRKEHIALFVVLFFILTAFAVLPFVIGKPYLVSLAPLAAFVLYGYQNNKMMIYVENSVYGS